MLADNRVPKENNFYLKYQKTKYLVHIYYFHSNFMSTYILNLLNIKTKHFRKTYSDPEAALSKK